MVAIINVQYDAKMVTELYSYILTLDSNCFDYKINTPGGLMTDYKDNIEIDLKDLFRYILQYWKLIILGILVGAVIGGCYAAVTGQERQEEDLILTQEDYRSILTEKEAREVELLYYAYNEYQMIKEEIDNSKAGATELQDRFELVESAYQLFTAQNALSANAKSYYNSLIEANLTDSTDAQADNTNISRENKTNATDMLKFALIGAFVGAIIVMGIYAMKYVLSPTVKTADDIRVAFELPILGTVSEQGSNANSNSFLSAAILGAARKEQAERIFMITSDENDRYREIVGNIQTDIKDGAGVSIVSGVHNLTDITVAKSINTKDAAVIVAQIKVSKYDDVAREIELCYNYGIRILGVIIIE